MNVVFSVFVFVLFFVLTPGVLLRLPSKGSKTTVTLVHGLIFSIILAVSGHFFWKYKKNVFEGAADRENISKSIVVYKNSGPGQTPGLETIKNPGTH
jgi:hypothetical protein